MWMAMIVAAGLAAPEQGVKFFDGAWDAALEEAARTKKLVLADFSTVW